ncbi:sulfotransferase family protein [Marinirhabdus gelatinilytica]|uniref:Sulfotransferase domain-containing protein n=1 Tax=Marinirhabdus gelatinilytica TaxID=1703343 RepID=A0A370QG35_9FLAO|nr:sulfotransferase [Marinirhabdus gelatinilytica]RDK87327.1 sulfotransferase domain-containing protein [Marinirhabdus gelatinilytica]
MKKIAIHSVPRSGSTWLGSIFDSHPNTVYRFQPLFSYAFKSFLDENASEERIERFFDDILKTKDPFICQVEAKEKGIIPTFKKEGTEVVVYKEVRYHNVLKNMLETSPDVSVVGLVRNPLATLNSWLRAPKEFKPELGWKIEEEWRWAPKKNLDQAHEFNGYEKWKETASLFEGLKSEFPDRFYLLRYSDLLKNTEGSIKKLFEFLDISVTEEVLGFLDESKNTQQKDSYSVFKTKKNDASWKQNLPEYIITHVLNDLKGTALEKYLD